jgi:hypothetical protein
MLLVDLYQALLDAQSVIPGLPGVPGGTAGNGGFIYTCSSNCSFVDGSGQPGCPASSFTQIGAAFATQGYFAHADLIWQLTHTDMGLWAPLLYILAAIGGLTSLAMGMPPKMYLWFFMGPAIYHFLLGTTLSTYGTSWCVANVPQDQTQVWKLAEVGLKNANITAREDIQILQYDQPGKPVQVSYLFLWFDSLISSTVQWMTVWTGVYQQVGSDSGDSGILKKPEGHSASTADQYYLLTTLKWPMLDRVTSARLHNGDVRDALVTFLSSECGDTLARSVEPGNLIAASNSKTGDIPYSVFRGVTAPQSAQGGGVGPAQCSAQSSSPRDYSNVTKRLSNQLIPVPRSVRRSWWNPQRNGGSVGSPQSGSLKGSLPGFYENYSFSYLPPSIPLGWLGGFFGFGGGGGFSIPIPPTHPGAARIDTYLESEDNMSCADLMFYVINGLRWEAGQIYYQLVSTAPQSMNSDQVLFNLFYGWDLRDQCGAKLEKPEQLRHFMQDLILVHLVRNEMAVAPKVVDSRYLQQSAVAGEAANRFIAETGAKQKFGEVYTWALMMPYVQGVLLYLLAMAYPFVCVMIVVPGWHKTLFTWMAFWTWVKLWDLGFAVVIVLERSIWAIMGNNSTAQNLSGHIIEMQNWAKVNVDTCRVGGNDCPVVPAVVDGMSVSGAEGLREAWRNLLAVWDRAMLVGSSIDIDVQSGYYIYIMSALYFAIPAVTGQLVLGAKAGAAGMVSNLTQGAQSDGGRAAGQAFTGNLRNTAAASAATIDQEKKAKDYRQSGLAAQAIEAGNAGLAASLAGSVASQTAQGLGNLQGMQKLVEGLRGNNLQTGSSLLKGITSSSGWLGSTFAGGTLGDAAKKSDAELNAETQGRSLDSPQGGNSMAPGGSSSSSAGSAVGAAFGSGGAGAGGATGSGATGSWASTAARGVGGVLTMGAAIKNAAIDMATAAQGNAIHRGYAGLYAGIQAQQADAGLAGFLAGAQGQGYQLHGNRISSAAGFSAEQAAWEGRRDFANSSSAYLSALGVDSSVVAPGPKPSDMTGMAMMGMLGSNIKASANYANPEGGAYFGQAQSAYGSLSSQYGGAALGAVYGAYNGDAVAEMGNAWGTHSGRGYGISEWDITPVTPGQDLPQGDRNFWGKE